MTSHTVQRLKKLFILLLGLWLLLSTTLVYIATTGDRILHAVISMGLGLIVLWVLAGGTLMYVLRDRVKNLVLRVPLHWQVKFVLFATLLAMVEEAVTTSMTSLAPLFGAEIGEAYITASSNYFDVILHHSVIAFVPWFMAWAWILKRYDFSPFWVFLLTGLNGLFAESLTFGWEHLNEFALWIFVYGLMVYLPACTIPAERGAVPPKPYHAVLAFLLPFLVGIPWATLVNLLFPNHPAIHFPPIEARIFSHT
ncbi:MAG TPA: hypothetical protein VLT51_07400 [Anaerolineales bacterium]|nr:hypothetical protein [Anaerolineales bacterium]